jgi:hypothetical protein
MTINTKAAEPAPISGSSRQVARQAGEEKRRRRVVMLVMAAAAARIAVDKRTLAGVIVIAIGVAAMKGMTQERGFPVLDWYRSLGRDKNPNPT